MSDSSRFAIRLSDRGMRILRYPLTRLVLALLFLIAFTGLALGLASMIRGALPAGQDLVADAIQMVLACTFAWVGYALYCHTVEGRKVYELDTARGPRQLLWGLLIGFGLLSLVMLIIYLSGGYKVKGVTHLSVLGPVIIMSVQAGIVEEILSRGVLFRITEEWIGTTGSILFSGLMFGFMHMWNPNATVFSSVSIALTAGVVLAVIYVLTRQLWIPIGLHIGWNFTLGGIYGAPVSGNPPAGLLDAEFPGPNWLTGGAFGPEASIVSIAVFSVVAIVLIRKALREKRWVRPSWRIKHD